MENEKSIFLDLFGDYPLNRVLDFLITYEGFDYSMVEIAEKSRVGYSTLKLFWPHLVENKIVIQTRKIGNAKLFKLNISNPIVKKFSDFYWAVTFKRAHKLMEAEGIHSEQEGLLIEKKAKLPKKKSRKKYLRPDRLPFFEVG